MQHCRLDAGAHTLAHPLLGMGESQVAPCARAPTHHDRVWVAGATPVRSSQAPCSHVGDPDLGAHHSRNPRARPRDLPVLHTRPQRTEFNLSFVWMCTACVLLCFAQELSIN